MILPEFANWFPTLKSIHIGLVLPSGGLFALRGPLVLARKGWTMALVALVHHPLGLLQPWMTHGH